MRRVWHSRQPVGQGKEPSLWMACPRRGRGRSTISDVESHQPAAFFRYPVNPNALRSLRYDNIRQGSSLIESGSLTPGIDPVRFGLPAGTALRIEEPAAALRSLLPTYGVLDSDPREWQGPDSWILPGWAQLWIVLTDGPITVGVGQRRPVPLGSAMLFGGTSQAMRVTSRGGVSVVVDISPMGWARLFDFSAETMRDRIVPLDEVMPGGWADELVALLHASDRQGAVKPLLDDFFQRRLPRPHPDEPIIAHANDLLLYEEGIDGGEMAERLGMTQRALLTLCTRYFGHGPKVITRRRRFLRVLTAMMMADEQPDFSAPPPGYHDVPHFLRDSNLFVGLTPRRFLALPMPYLRAVLRARTQVLGAPLPMFDALTTGSDDEAPG